MKPWRDAASIILTARSQQSRITQNLTAAAFQYDYKLLGLKRQDNSSFMPGFHVFPGGTIDAADADLKWQNLFNKFGFDNQSFTWLLPNTTGARPQIFKAKRNELPREISLRITAIRETFEECGILLCRESIKKKGVLSEWAENFPCKFAKSWNFIAENHDEIFMVSVGKEDRKNWQERIHNDATEFYKLCEGLDCYPDVWALHEWSNWLTPPFHEKKRFDAIFFLACMNKQPETGCDMSEIAELRWDDPKELINPTTRISLGPPQHYEISRIAKFESLDNLLDFAVERSKFGCHLNCPVRVKLSDGAVFLFVGDSMYPEDVNLIENEDLDYENMTIAEFRKLSEVINRLEFYDLEVKRVVTDNFNSKDGHLSPLPLETVQVKSRKSKV